MASATWMMFLTEYERNSVTDKKKMFRKAAPTNFQYNQQNVLVKWVGDILPTFLGANYTYVLTVNKL